jgi:hypothetical protein
MAKSEIRTIHVWWGVENLVFQHIGGRENDLAISIIFGDEGVPGTVLDEAPLSLILVLLH